MNSYQRPSSPAADTSGISSITAECSWRRDDIWHAAVGQSTSLGAVNGLVSVRVPLSGYNAALFVHYPVSDGCERPP